jgi:hypothetical protein
MEKSLKKKMYLKRKKMNENGFGLKINNTFNLINSFI